MTRAASLIESLCCDCTVRCHVKTRKEGKREGKGEKKNSAVEEKEEREEGEGATRRPQGRNGLAVIFESLHP